MIDCSNPDTQKFLDLLDSFDLQQHVKQPTHRDGHTLDLSITRKSETLVEDEPTVDLFISDHAAVLTRLGLSRPGLYSTANDPEAANDPQPQVIPKVDRKRSRKNLRHGMDFMGLITKTD